MEEGGSSLPRRPNRSSRESLRRHRSRRRNRHLFRLRNTFDFSRLEPGDLVLVANPTDPPHLQAVLFWSHVAIYVGESDEYAFIDAVDLPVRGAERRGDRTLLWQRVRYTGLRAFQSYVDILALRPDLPAEARRAAAEYARARVGTPFFGRLVKGFLRPRGARAGRAAGSEPASATASGAPAGGEPAEFTCASLIWHAYLRQGLDLASGPLRRWILPWPSLLGHDRRLRHLGRGTRVKPLRFRPGQMAYFLARAWFRFVLRSDIAWRGEPD